MLCHANTCLHIKWNDVIIQNFENVNHDTGVKRIPTHVHVLCNGAQIK